MFAVALALKKGRDSWIIVSNWITAFDDDGGRMVPRLQQTPMQGVGTQVSAGKDLSGGSGGIILFLPYLGQDWKKNS